MMYIDLEVKTALIVHGFDENNQEIVERVQETDYVRKLISIDRIQSISKQYLLVTSSHGRMMYWEYNCSIDELKQLLHRNSLMIN
ncbi:hypothetical protein HGP29_18650 [Flammeovirga sp. SR4]|uniref:Uncharacterized protein n=2 Tax=Flammeovirga agarivorans TaxID=2726742 RepID=A0A7X8XXG6_9BACT|nr:hypothetical protein [Flammeovirga agarivorans]